MGAEYIESGRVNAGGGGMPSYWIVKTEPSTYSFDQLERDKTTVWDGVRNNLALKHLRQMKRGDRVLVYHTGEEKAVVGLAEVAAEAYPDPKQKDPKLVVVELKAAQKKPNLSKESKAHLAESLGTLEDALKAPLLRMGA